MPALISLRALASSGLWRDEREFFAQYGQAVLVVPLPTDKPGGGEDGAKARYDSTATSKWKNKPTGFETFLEESGPEGSPAAHKARQRTIAGDALVFSLEKTERNQFANMITVGRAFNNDIPIPVPTISKLHGYFMKSAQTSGWRFCDSGSMNGVWLRGSRLEPRSGAELACGDELLMGPDVPTVFRTPAGLLAAVKRLGS